MLKGQAEDTPLFPKAKTASHVLSGKKTKTKPKTLVQPLGLKILGFWQNQQCVTDVSNYNNIFLKVENFFASI